MTLSQWVTTYLGKKIGTGQCVPAVQSMLLNIDGINFGAIGDAIDYANTTNQAKFASVGWMWHSGLQSLQDDDTLVWDNDPGNFTGPDGHIAKSYQSKILNQNNNAREYVTIDNFFSQGYLGLYRKVDEMLTEDNFYSLFRMSLHRDPTLKEAQTFTRDPNLAVQTLWVNGGQTLFQGEEGATNPTVLNPGVYEVK